MTEFATAEVILTLMVPPAHETDMVDWLMARAEAPGFFSFAGRGHGEAPSTMTVREQVAGRREGVAFQLLCPAERAHNLLAGLEQDFAGTGLRYWLLPVLGSGRL
ncbi:uncharacterized protein DUF3240 [Rhodothalassium salexigens DSM 2132]|uniref:Uncharacterized protein DUF3240 n=1 Tax=Rhodothalassium salexigens DSM 2132 TaxID=1188247 RepID=A0A4R2PU97_RHOSA|nr:DUF3240 family protein [Rhodothalassium salexigens]MBB4210739.1 hypothetical protein [Rhodothalassium salexigens DSM 2132]MBK1638280.1 hypothetical protein [Rhodothalassium salexigens DSM 2132]TCP37705.1 uncharacterized protein DUF3240 [Rhodothalassium salexigens DSM 2132]